MKKVLLSLAATLLLVAGFTTNADAQRRGGPGVRVGGGAVMVGGPGIRRAGFVGGPGIRRAGFVGGPGWVGGRRWVGGPWWGHRRPFIRAGFIGAGFGYPYYAYGGCRRWRVVPTPWGPQWRLVNVCYAPVGFYGYGGYPGGYYGGIY